MPNFQELKSEAEKKASLVVFYSQNCAIRAYAGATTNFQIVLNTTKNAILNKATHKNTCLLPIFQNLRFQTPKNPSIIPIT